jgi:hypothetical protein
LPAAQEPIGVVNRLVVSLVIGAGVEAVSIRTGNN